MTSRPLLLLSASATAVMALWLCLFVEGVYGGRWSGLFLHGDHFQLPADMVDDDLYRIKGPSYDGQFYRLIAHDPFFQKNYSPYIDLPRARYQRILVPILAWIAAGGQERWIDPAYIAISLAFIGLGVWWSGRLAVELGFPAILGLAFAFFPTTILSIHRMVMDGPFVALVVGFILYAWAGDTKRLIPVLVAACLCRETGLLLIVAYCLHLLLRRQWFPAAAASCSVLPAVGWWWFVNARTPASPPLAGGVPVEGLLQRLFILRHYDQPPVIQAIIQAADFLSLVGVVLAVVLAIAMVIRKPSDPVALAAIAYTALVAVLFGPASAWIDLRCCCSIRGWCWNSAFLYRC